MAIKYIEGNLGEIFLQMDMPVTPDEVMIARDILEDQFGLTLGIMPEELKRHVEEASETVEDTQGDQSSEED